MAVAGALVLIASAAPASAQDTICTDNPDGTFDCPDIIIIQDPGAYCTWVRPLANGDRECLGTYGLNLGYFPLTLVAILGPDDPVFGDPPVCTSETGSTPTSELQCEEFDFDFPDPGPGPAPIVIVGCGLFLDIFTTDCLQPDDPEFSSDPDYVSPLFVPQLADLTNALAALEGEAVEEVLDAHQLPVADSARVLDFARADVRALLYQRIIEIAALDPSDRTVEEQQLVDGYAEAIRLRRVLAAQLARQEYAEWASDPCSYVPPGGYPYDPGSLCDGPSGGLGSLFSTVPPPSRDQFLQYGLTRALDFLTNEERGALVAADTKQAWVKWVAAGAAGVGAAILVGVAIYAALAVIFPISVGLGIGLGGAAVSTGVVAGLAVAGPVGIVILAVIIAVVQGINVFAAAEIPGQLDAAITKAALPVNLTQGVQAEDEAVLQELFAAFIASTLPDNPGEGAPAAFPTDDRFHIISLDSILDHQGNGVVSPQIDFMSWTDTDWSARLSGGWFVVSGEAENADGEPEPFEGLSLKIPYVGWDDWHWIAWRVGKDFLHLRAGPDSDPEDPEDSFVSNEIRFTDTNGARQIATIVSDLTPPVITPQVAGTLGDDGWYTSDVTLSWSVSDPETAVESQSSGCGTEQITSDVTAFMRTCTASSEGGEASASVTLKRDATPPSIVHALSPSPNANGWNDTSPVAVHFTCADAGSGIAFCTPDATASGDGSWPWLGEARDAAGNSSSLNLAVNIDTTPPSISGTASPPANAAGWNKTDVTVSFACSDPLAGLASASGIASCTAPQTLSSEGTDQEVSGTAVDNAGNSSSTTVDDIDIDETPPVVSLVTPPEGASYVQNEVVLAQWTATDALSGIASESGSAADGQPVDMSSAGDHVFTVEATDAAGNTSQVSHGYTVLSAAQAATTLVSQVDGVVSHKGTKNALTSKLANARQSLARGNQNAAEGKLNAFINQVRAQRGKKIAVADADALIAYARLILGATTSPSS